MRFPVDTINIKTLFNQATHRGVDFGWFGATSNQPLYSCYAGTVIEIRNNCNSTTPGSGTYGNYVKIKFDNGIYGLYAHCKYGSVCVSVNQRVIEHQKVAEIGNTGDSYGPHCHFEIFEGSNKVDPLKYLEVYSGQEIYSNSIKKDLTYHKEIKKAFINKMDIYPDINSVQVIVGADVAIDWAKYSLNGANFVDLPANGIITGLTPNKSYTVACKVETTGTKEWTTSETYKFTTKSNIVELTYAGTPVARNEEVDQLEVTNNKLHYRDGANANVKGYINVGVYNVLNQSYAGSYNWVQVESDKWVAQNDEWNKLLPKKEVVTPTPVEPTPVTPVNDTPQNSQKEDDTDTKDENGTITPEEDKQVLESGKSINNDTIDCKETNSSIIVIIFSTLIILFTNYWYVFMILLILTLLGYYIYKKTR